MFVIQFCQLSALHIKAAFWERVNHQLMSHNLCFSLKSRFCQVFGKVKLDNYLHSWGGKTVAFLIWVIRRDYQQVLVECPLGPYPCGKAFSVLALRQQMRISTQSRWITSQGPISLPLHPSGDLAVFFSGQCWCLQGWGWVWGESVKASPPTL